MSERRVSVHWPTLISAAATFLSWVMYVVALVWLLSDDELVLVVPLAASCLMCTSVHALLVEMRSRL